MSYESLYEDIRTILESGSYNKNSYSHTIANKIKKNWLTSHKFINDKSVLVNIKRGNPEKIVHNIMGGYADERGYEDSELNNLSVTSGKGKAKMKIKKISNMEYEILITDK